MRTLILGYGNVDRGDDGLGYHVVDAICRRLVRAALEPYGDEPAMVTDEVGLLFQRQLVPEMAEFLADFDRVFFVDAHTGAFDEEVREVELKPEFAPQSLTHHLSPETLLFLTEAMFGSYPSAWLYSARGYDFDFCNQLSERTALLADRIVEQILQVVGQ